MGLHQLQSNPKIFNMEAKTSSLNGNGLICCLMLYLNTAGRSFHMGTFSESKQSNQR